MRDNDVGGGSAALTKRALDRDQEEIAGAEGVTPTTGACTITLPTAGNLKEAIHNPVHSTKGLSRYGLAPAQGTVQRILRWGMFPPLPSLVPMPLRTPRRPSSARTESSAARAIDEAHP